MTNLSLCFSRCLLSVALILFVEFNNKRRQANTQMSYTKDVRKTSIKKDKDKDKIPLRKLRIIIGFNSMINVLKRKMLSVVSNKQGSMYLLLLV